MDNSDTDEKQAIMLEKYGIFLKPGDDNIDLGAYPVLEVLGDVDNKDAVDDLINAFYEKIEQEAAAKDSKISRDRKVEWDGIQEGVIEN